MAARRFLFTAGAFLASLGYKIEFMLRKVRFFWLCMEAVLGIELRVGGRGAWPAPVGLGLLECFFKPASFVLSFSNSKRHWIWKS